MLKMDNRSYSFYIIWRIDGIVTYICLTFILNFKNLAKHMLSTSEVEKYLFIMLQYLPNKFKANQV